MVKSAAMVAAFCVLAPIAFRPPLQRRLDHIPVGRQGGFQDIFSLDTWTGNISCPPLRPNPSVTRPDRYYPAEPPCLGGQGLPARNLRVIYIYSPLRARLDIGHVLCFETYLTILFFCAILAPTYY